jgi:hypothetical protein
MNIDLGVKVQEEIMFATCPELHVSVAICERMLPH